MITSFPDHHQVMNDWLEHHRTLVLSAVGLLLAAAIGIAVLRWRAPTPVVINPPPPTATTSPMRIYVSGAVMNPDVYILAPDSIVRDAIDAAGGPSPDADLNSINLAQALKDGDQIYVPVMGEVPTAAPVQSESSGAEPVSGPININTASQAELETLPGIGPAIAQRIIDYREANGPFPSIDAIQNVSGIGPAIFDGIKDLIVTE